MEKPVVLITGATSGIGRATAELFMHHGFFTLLTGRRLDRLNEILQTNAGRCDVFAMDIRRRKDSDALLDYIKEKKYSPMILINNAGLAAGLAPAHEADWNDWEQMIDTNVKGLLYLTRGILPMMVDRKQGHIINVGSVAGKQVYPNGSVYCATKFAVEALTQGLRMDLLPYGIKVSSVSPGMVETEFSLVRFKGDAEKAKQVYAGLQPLKAGDVAEAIYWIATRPPHVHIQDIWIMPSAQASPFVVRRDT